MASILLTCGDSDFLGELRKCFRDEPGFRICGECLLGVDVVTKALRLHPDLIILEMAISLSNSCEILEALKSGLPEVPLFLITEENSMLIEKAALARGFDAVFARGDAGPSLVKNARAVVGLAAEDCCAPGELHP